MIFVCLGTQIYQFDRLLKKIDDLIESGSIKEDVFAQIGHSTYVPKHYNYCHFMSKQDFDKCIEESSLIISHGGTGVLISSSKLGKNIIGVPRLKKYGEHLDDHQLQIVSVLEEHGYIRSVYDMDNLGDVILESLASPISKKYERESKILPILIDFIDKN